MIHFNHWVPGNNKCQQTRQSVLITITIHFSMKVAHLVTLVCEICIQYMSEEWLSLEQCSIINTDQCSPDVEASHSMEQLSSPTQFSLIDPTQSSLMQEKFDHNLIWWVQGWRCQISGRCQITRLAVDFEAADPLPSDCWSIPMVVCRSSKVVVRLPKLVDKLGESSPSYYASL